MIIGLLIAGIILIIVGGAATAFTTIFVGIPIFVVGIVLTGLGGAIRRGRKIPTPAMTTEMHMGGPMDDMVKALAKAPEPQRREMIRTRLASFAEMSDSERANAMKMMMQAVMKLDPESIKKMTYTRLEALAEDFDAATRKKLMGTHMMILMGLPREQMMADVNAMISVMGQCHEECRMKDVSTMKTLMMEMPEDKRKMMMDMLPSEMKMMMM